MTDAVEQTALIFANHEIQHNHHRRYVTLDRVDPMTGEFSVQGQVVTLAPGKCHEVPQGLADELFVLSAKQEAVGAPPCIRAADDRETLSYRHAKGDFNTQA